MNVIVRAVLASGSRTRMEVCHETDNSTRRCGGRRRLRDRVGAGPAERRRRDPPTVSANRSSFLKHLIKVELTNTVANGQTRKTSLTMSSQIHQ